VQTQMRPSQGMIADRRAGGYIGDALACDALRESSLSLSLSLSLCAVTGPPLLAGIPSQRGRGRPRRRGKDVRLSGRDAFTALSLAAAPADFSAAVSPRARPSTGACPSITTPSPVVLAEALTRVPSRVVSSRVSRGTLSAASVKARFSEGSVRNKRGALPSFLEETLR
jgi:hypothetical protein